VTLAGKRIPRSLLYLTLSCLMYVSVEGLCLLGLVALRAKGAYYDPLPSSLSQEQKNVIIALLEDRPTLLNHHPILGWAPKPNTHSKDVRINSQGIRSEHDYARDVEARRARVTAFGDSFTFGSELDGQATWEQQLEDKDARFEVLNFGVGAYGLDQAYLRYLLDGVLFNSDIVVIGFMSENIYRNLNVFRPFYSSMYRANIYTKPRFLIENGNLSLFKNPLTTVEDYRRFLTNSEGMLREIGSRDYFYHMGYLAGPMDRLPSVRLLKIATRSAKERLNPVVTREGSYAVSSEGFLLASALFEEFYCAALQHESLPVILIFPDLGDFVRQRSRLTRRYKPLLESFERKGFRYLDTLDAFVAHDPQLPLDRLTVDRWGHYSHLGNELVAKHLQRYLTDQGLVNRDVIKTLARAAREKQICPKTRAVATVRRESVLRGAKPADLPVKQSPSSS